MQAEEENINIENLEIKQKTPADCWVKFFHQKDINYITQ